MEMSNMFMMEISNIVWKYLIFVNIEHFMVEMSNTALMLAHWLVIASDCFRFRHSTSLPHHYVDATSCTILTGACLPKSSRGHQHVRHRAGDVDQRPFFANRQTRGVRHDNPFV